MIESLIPWGVALITLLIGGGVGWSQVKKHGAEKEARKWAERERDAAIEVAANRGNPLETVEQRRESARIELERRLRHY
jgi:biopolymer transport protein ExbB/TolQ